MSFNVRVATLDDISAIQHVARSTWRATYAGLITGQNIERFVNSAYSDDSLQGTLERLGGGLLVAQVEREVIGYAMLGSADEYRAELYAIYVLPGCHGHGIGWALWNAAAARAVAIGCRTLELWVLDSNQRARRFYERQGAVVTGIRDFRVGDETISEFRYTLSLPRSEICVR
jgi:ribosomal protein S18 acetylase RimI-like enzyme